MILDENKNSFKGKKIYICHCQKSLVRKENMILVREKNTPNPVKLRPISNHE